MIGGWQKRKAETRTSITCHPFDHRVAPAANSSVSIRFYTRCFVRSSSNEGQEERHIARLGLTEKSNQSVGGHPVVILDKG